MRINDEEKLETFDIGVELGKLGNSGVLPPRTASACGQAAWMLKAMREIVLNPELSDAAIVEKLKLILSRHHEG
jgi:hypothetical protein